MDESTKNISQPADLGIRSTLLGIAVNFLLAIIKIFTGLVGNSYVLIADGIESFSDVFSSIVVYSGLRIAAVPPDEHHPYGHGKAEPIAASIVSIFLVGAAIVISIQSIQEILGTQVAPAPYTLIVLIGVIIVKESLFRSIIKVGDSIESLAVKTDAWHHRSDAITSAAALVGISIALIGGEGWESADDFAALFASAIILFNAVRLLRPAVQDLMDHSPPSSFEEEIREIASGVEGVVALDKYRARKVGFVYYIDLDVIVKGSITVSEGHKIGHKVREEIKNQKSNVANVFTHVEPDDSERLSRVGKPDNHEWN
jgi:cation diffusion facilitator family transporter